MTDQLLDDTRPLALLVQFKADALTLIQSEPYREAGYVALIGMAQVLEALMRKTVRMDPASATYLLNHLAEMHQHLASVACTARVLDDDQTH